MLFNELISLVAQNKKAFARFEQHLLLLSTQHADIHLQEIILNWKNQVAQHDKHALFDLIEYD
jgi:hypothetical protein